MQKTSEGFFRYLSAALFPIIIFSIGYLTIFGGELYTVKKIYILFLIFYTTGVFFAYYNKPYKIYKNII
jgi:hypothetical protein